MKDGRFGLGPEGLKRLLDRVSGPTGGTPFDPVGPSVSNPAGRLPGATELAMGRRWLESRNLPSPYGRLVEPGEGAAIRVDGHPVVGFASYDYLGIGRDPRLARAAAEAIERWGSSAFASRLVSGERSVHRELEAKLADLHRTEAALTFVSGHATNVSVLGTILAGGGVLVHDERIHNSVIQGAALARARSISFSHNEWEAADRRLAELGRVDGIVVVVIEGLYSMDGDVPDLGRFVETARRHGAWLMVDEAHSIGVLGPTGGGIGELTGLTGDAVDLWMGTLSKALAGCGGYIAASKALIDYLRLRTPAFVFSVGVPPPMAAISLDALRILREEPQRVGRLQDLGRHALETARRLKLDTGRAHGHAILPIIIGSSGATVRLSQSLLESGWDVPPAIPPAVEDRGARLRLFLSAAHTEDQITGALEGIAAVGNAGR